MTALLSHTGMHIQDERSQLLSAGVSKASTLCEDTYLTAAVITQALGRVDSLVDPRKISQLLCSLHLHSILLSPPVLLDQLSRSL